MTKYMYAHQKIKTQGFARLPNFLFEVPTFLSLSNDAKLMYAMLLRRAELSRKNGWKNEYGRIYVYYAITEVMELLRCGKQKAVKVLRELQYAGLLAIRNQGCGKPNQLYPKVYEMSKNQTFPAFDNQTPAVGESDLGSTIINLQEV